jgi:hypothetical protein
VLIGMLVAAAALLLSVGLRSVFDGAKSERPFLLLRAGQGTVYRHHASDEGDVVMLTEGQLTVDVRHGQRGRSVLVKTPDGEVEDVGTVFTVVVTQGRTESVTVAEGRVVVRIAEQSEHWVATGETYLPYPRPLSQITAPAVRASEPRAHDVEQAGVRELEARGAPQKPKRASAKPAVEAHASSADTTGGDEPAERAESTASALESFARAVRRVETHDDAVAITLLDRFLAHFPSDARAEDAAFLRVVVLARGDSTALARAAARRYLARYPQGLRARDVQRLLDQAEPATR